MRICTVQEMRECDRRASEEYGLPEVVLMENAGRAVFEVARREFGTDEHRYCVVCGGGNNGGDGFVAARLLHSVGADVRVALLADERAIGGVARANLEAAVRCGVPVQRLSSVEDLHPGRSSDVVVDAMLGTGLSRSPEGLYAQVIERLNGAAVPVLAVDIPSGVNGDTGGTPGVAVRAACTVTFGLPKRGNLLPPGRELCGRLYVSHISFPPVLYERVGSVETVEPVPLPERLQESHKGTYGDVLFVAGASTYLGAPMLAALSFLKAGGGYARLATPQSIAPILGGLAREVVMLPLGETDEGTVAASNLERLRALAEKCDMVVIGPGLSTNGETQEMVRQMVAAVSVLVLVDGDGLSAIAGDITCVQQRTGGTILTPHTGEMARLLGTTVEDVQHDRVAATRELAQRASATVLLKGATTIVAESEGLASLSLTGNPGMATAGCGDVLTGAIAAMRGMGCDHRQAARIGAFIHGMAGDLAAEAKGQDGITAGDVMESLPHAVRRYRAHFRQLAGNHCGRLSVI